MTVLMFGWEFPPHISGGLGTACHGLSQALIEQGIDLLFVVPKAFGDEPIPLIDASQISVSEEPLETTRKSVNEAYGMHVISVPSTLKPYAVSEVSQQLEEWNWSFSETSTKVVNTDIGKRYAFSGGYGPSLLDEVFRYAEVSAAIASKFRFDVIHAHDWLTYMAGIEAKRVSGKPLVIHIHATEFDRAGRDNGDERVAKIEQMGFDCADIILAVSQWTKDIVVSRYNIAPAKVHVVHNGVVPVDEAGFPFLPKIGERVVTFLGRITYQKGPQYFIDAARKVLERFPETHFIMAGSGDMLPEMIERVAASKLSTRIHFTGFLKGKQIRQVWSVTDVYVMPSVSEPFGITPLEAVQAGVPVIVSNQSGVAEVMDHIIKVDFWNTDALADAIIGVMRHKGLSQLLKSNSKKEIRSLTWTRAAKKIIEHYHEL